MKPYDIFKYRGNDNTGVVSDLNVSAATYIVDYIGTLNQAAANIGLYDDGTIVLYYDGVGGTWHHTPATGIGASYWVIVNLTSGALTSGTTGSRVSLVIGQMWTLTTTGNASIRTANAVGTIEIWDAASGGNMVSSGTFKIECKMEATASSASDPILGGGEDHEIGQPLRPY